MMDDEQSHYYAVAEDGISYNPCPSSIHVEHASHTLVKIQPCPLNTPAWAYQNLSHHLSHHHHHSHHVGIRGQSHGLAMGLHSARSLGMSTEGIDRGSLRRVDGIILRSR